MKAIDVDLITADIATSEQQIRHLQSETIHHVSFSPAGKITVTNKPALEDLNNEIGRLTALAAHNSDVLHRLAGVLERAGATDINALDGKIRAAREKIESSKIGINRIAGGLLAYDHSCTLENIRNHPKIKDDIAAREQWIVEGTKALEFLTPILDEVRTIASEFRPSKLAQVERDQPHLIDRAAVAGFGV